MSLYPWAQDPFDLLLHGEQHYRDGDDFGRRMALISFDQSVEVSVACYLALKPIHRQNRSYSGEDVIKWVFDFHTKVDFFLDECQRRKLVCPIPKDDFVWYHNLRGKQYHQGGTDVPKVANIQGARRGAHFVFQTLFSIADLERLLDDRLTPAVIASSPPQSDPDLDAALDALHGEVMLAGSPFRTSDVLFRFDPIAYRELGLSALEETTKPSNQGLV